MKCSVCIMMVFCYMCLNLFCSAVDIPAELQKKANEGDRQALIQIGHLYYNNKEIDKAVKVYEKVADLQDGSFMAMLMLARINHIEYKNYIKAKYWLQKLVNKHPNNLPDFIYEEISGIWNDIRKDEKGINTTEIINALTSVTPEQIRHLSAELNDTKETRIYPLKQPVYKPNKKLNNEKVVFAKIDDSQVKDYYKNNKNHPKVFLPYVGLERIPDDVQQRLIRDRFAIVDEDIDMFEKKDDMIQAYKTLCPRWDPKGSIVSIFVTTDWLMHTFRTINYKIQVDVERKALAPLLISFTGKMYKEIDEYRTTEEGLQFKDHTNVLYDIFSIAAVLSGDASAEKNLSQNAKKELALIRDGKESYRQSYVTGKIIDYTRFIPRIHYRETEQLSTYWRVFTWLSSLRFSIDMNKYPDDIQQFALLYTVLSRNKESTELYTAYCKTVQLFFGNSDAYSFQTLEKITDLNAIISDANTRADFIAALPKSANAPLLPAAEYFEILPQTNNIDLYAIERFGVKEESRREYRISHGYDTAAIFGNAFGNELIQKDFKDFSLLEGEYTKVTTLAGRYSEVEWQSNLHMRYLSLLKELYSFGSNDNFYFTRSKNWEKKALMTGLSAWTQRMHDSVLYREPFATAWGQAFELTKHPIINYVEPNLMFFYRMKQILASYTDFISTHDIVDEKLREALNRYVAVIDILSVIVDKEALNQPISSEENEYINSLVYEMEQIVEAKSSLQEVIDLYATEKLAIRTDDPRMALVTDIAKWINPEAKIDTYQLNAIGKPLKLYVALNDTYGGKRIGVGYVYSYYEFMSNDLLTDETWREQVYPQEGETVETKTDKSKQLKGKMPMWVQELVIEGKEKMPIWPQ